MPFLGDYKITGRDSLVFLVDASKEMFVKGEDGQASNFDLTMQVSWSHALLLLQRISKNHLLSCVCSVFVGCAQCVHQ